MCCKVHNQPDIASDSTDGEIRCMYKAVNKTKVIRGYMESLALHTGTPTVHWDDNTSCIYVVEVKIVTPGVKHIDIHVCIIKNKLTMVSLFQNMRSLVLFRHICAPNHVKVQISVRVLNG